MGFADNLKKAREKCGLTQKQLAGKVHVTESAINQYESGAKLPKADVLIQLAKALKTTAEKLWD